MHVSPGIKIDNVECSLLSAVTDAAGVVPCYPRSFFKAPLTVSPIKSTWTKSKQHLPFAQGGATRQRVHHLREMCWPLEGKDGTAGSRQPGDGRELGPDVSFKQWTRVADKKPKPSAWIRLPHLLVRFVSYHILKIQYLPIISFRRKPSQNSSRVGRAAITCKTMLKTKCVRNPVASPLKSPGAGPSKGPSKTQEANTCVLNPEKRHE